MSLVIWLVLDTMKVSTPYGYGFPPRRQRDYFYNSISEEQIFKARAMTYPAPVLHIGYLLPDLILLVKIAKTLDASQQKEIGLD